MSLTHRSGGPLLAAYHHSGDRGRGRLASDFSGEGLSGPSLPWLSLGPGDMGKEVWARVDVVPPGLTLFRVDELGNIDAEGPVGVHEGQFSLFFDGVATDPPSAAFFVVIGENGVSGGLVGADGVMAGTVGINPATQVSGSLVGDDGAMQATVGTNPATNVTGGLVGDDGVMQGTVGSIAPTIVSGTLVGDDGAMQGGVAINAPTLVGGNLVGDDGEASGRIFGGGPTLPPPLDMPRVRRLVRSDRTVPTWVAPLDQAELADIYFDFSPSLINGDLVVGVAVTCEARVGTDADAAAMRVGEPVFDAWRAVQRIRPGVAGVIYLVRAVATLATGQTATAAAFMRVRRLG